MSTTYTRLGYRPDEGLPWELFVVVGTAPQRAAFIAQLQARLHRVDRPPLAPADHVADEVCRALGIVGGSEGFHAEGREGWWQLEAEADRVEERIRAGAPGPFVLLVDDAEEVIWARGEVARLRELARRGVRVILASGSDVGATVAAFDVKPRVFRIS